MRVLGLSLGDTSTAALMVGERVVACVSEERFSGVKRDESYPRRAIDWCLKAGGVRGEELDAVALGGARWDFWRWLARYYSGFSIDDLVREQEEYWRPRARGKPRPWAEVFADKLAGAPAEWAALAGRLSKETPLPPEDLKTADAFLDSLIAGHLGVHADKILRVDRKSALAAYAYWASPFRGKGAGVVVLDGGGAEPAATVSAPLRFGLMGLVDTPPAQFRLPGMLREVTLMLGLPPRDHDPALMGLAASAPSARWKPAYKLFAAEVSVKGVQFAAKAGGGYFRYLEALRSLADDAAAGGAQRFAEDTVAKWADNVARLEHLDHLAIAGSLSMNHRAMARVAGLPSVRGLFVPPGAGDGALALGACFQAATSRFGAVPAPWSHCYTGPDVAAEEVDAAVASLRAGGSQFEVERDASPRRVAQLLAGGAVVGRCAGRLEFGSRGLGNRSILADPRNARVIPVLAAKIKRRGAHAAFSPTILASAAPRYLANPKKLGSPFMTLAFPVKARARADLAAAVDADGSTRPQILEDQANPEFAAILRAFEKKTGVGALLNTSLNDSGKPIALGAADAARVFATTSLDYLLLGGTLLAKRSAALRRGGGRPGN